jgi:hypothetical protein
MIAMPSLIKKQGLLIWHDVCSTKSVELWRSAIKLFRLNLTKKLENQRSPAEPGPGPLRGLCAYPPSLLVVHDWIENMEAI